MNQPKSELDHQRAVFDLLTEMADLEKGERERILDQKPAGLADEIRRLLALEASNDEFLATQIMVDTREQLSQPEHTFKAPEPGTQIGPYEVLETLGEGGMGIVIKAQQQEPIQRTVAIKLLRVNFAADDTRERFIAEQRAMEKLQHPNIGQILDAGSTEQELPFLVMEYVEGVPITDYCDQNQLALKERLRLFIDVCRAVEHVHRRLLLHRDIKPSNVLVTEIDGTAAPKLIDFGIAALLDQTKSGDSDPMPLGTPAYMSPEALDFADAVDTRTDVFSLGVLLYRLLTGRLPWLGEDRTLAQLLKNRTHGQSSPPSVEFKRSLNNEESQIRANAMRSSPAVLRKTLRGDLDCIVRRCLAEHPDDRYSSALKLAEEIERFLQQRPIEARPANLSYVLHKAFQRNKAAFIGAGLALLAITVGITATTVSLIRALEAEHEAIVQAEQAENAREQAQQVADFLTNLFSQSGPSAPQTTQLPTETTALELLERGTARIETELAEQPLLQSRLQTTIAQVYSDLGLYDTAAEQVDAALTRMRSLPSDSRTGQQAIELGNMLVTRSNIALQTSALDDAEQFLLEANALPLSESSDEAIELSGLIRANLGRLYRARGELERAEQHLVEAVKQYRTHFGDDNLSTANMQYALAVVYFSAQRWDEAEAEFQQALNTFEQHLPPEHSRLLSVRNALAASLASQNKLDEAAPVFAQVLQGLRASLGNEHPRVAESLNNLGVLHADLGDYEQALDFHYEALNIRRTAFGEDNPQVAWSLDNLAHVHAALDDFDTAHNHQQQALTIRKSVLGEDHLETARSYSHLAELASQRDEIEQAIQWQTNSVRIHRDQLSSDHPNLGHQMIELGMLYWLDNRSSNAHDQIEQGLVILRSSADARPETLQETLAELERIGYLSETGRG